MAPRPEDMAGLASLDPSLALELLTASAAALEQPPFCLLSHVCTIQRRSVLGAWEGEPRIGSAGLSREPGRRWGAGSGLWVATAAMKSPRWAGRGVCCRFNAQARAVEQSKRELRVSAGQRP